MKVLLIQPPSVTDWSRRIFAHEPLALEDVGAGLKLDGHDVQVLDARFDPDVEGKFRQWQPEVVGLTAFTVPAPWVKRTAERLKAIAPHLLLVGGGHHATVRPADFNSPAINAVVIGEGVFTLRELLAKRQAGQPFDSIPGLALHHRLGGLRPYGWRDSLRILRHTPEIMRTIRNGHLDCNGHADARRVNKPIST
jgi:radical SAM superfamily enzyme YgiQ (UPF0313 family)